MSVDHHPNLQPSADSNAVLKQRIDELERRVAELEAGLAPDGLSGSPEQRMITERLPAERRTPIRQRIFLAAALGLAGLPAWLVVSDRWLNRQVGIGLLSDWWGQLNQTLHLDYSPYFMLVFACVLALAVVMWLSRNGPLVAFSAPGAAGGGPDQATLPGWQTRASAVLLTGALVGCVWIGGNTLIRRTVPGLGLALALLAFWLGWLLRDYSLPRLAQALARNRDVLLSALLVHLAQVAYLAVRYSAGPDRPTWLAGLLLLLAFLNLLRYFRRIPTIFWIVSLALLLLTFNLDAWWLAIIGDEYSFYSVGRTIAQGQSFAQISARFFSDQGVFGKFSYLSSLIMAASLKLFGYHNFGWRFSNLYLSAAAIGLFYFFFKTFLPRRIALLAAFMLACSHYLMVFAKIGYNNMQAFFAMGLVLAAAAWALTSKRFSAYSALGLALGFCFYAYPTALYVIPLPFGLLALFDPPRSRPAWARWGLLAFSMLAVIFPTFFQSSVWQTKIEGTFFCDPEITGSAGALLGHLARNSVYAFFSPVYILNQSHHVAVSYLDPLSGALFWLGLFYASKYVRQARFALFMIFSYLAMLILTGASHCSVAPSTTRMFMLLPWYALFTAMGLAWTQQQVQGAAGLRIAPASLIWLALAALLGLNLYQAYPLAYRMWSPAFSFETLLLRTTQRAQAMPQLAEADFVFIAHPDWDTDGPRLLQQVYNSPGSPSQIKQVRVTGGSFAEADQYLLASPHSLVIINPWMEMDWVEPLQDALGALGKTACDVRTPDGTLRFQIWHSGEAAELCR